MRATAQRTRMAVVALIVAAAAAGAILIRISHRGRWRFEKTITAMGTFVRLSVHAADGGVTGLK